MSPPPPREARSPFLLVLAVANGTGRWPEFFKPRRTALVGSTAQTHEFLVSRLAAAARKVVPRLWWCGALAVASESAPTRLSVPGNKAVDERGFADTRLADKGTDMAVQQRF